MPLYGSRYVPASILAAEQEIQGAAAREAICCGDPLASDRPKFEMVGGVRVDVPNATAQRIYLKCNALADRLVQKNEAYGDAALNPSRTFARGSASDLIRARIDDKLSRIRNNPDAFGEDPVVDLAGYLILLMLAIEDEEATSRASGMAGRTGN